MERAIGPIKLGSLDMLIGLTAMRLLFGSRVHKLSQWFLGIWLIGLTVYSFQAAAFWAAGSVGVFFLVIFIVTPILASVRHVPFTLTVTHRGLLGKSGSTETLYRAIKAGEIRVVFGRLLIPVEDAQVFIVPKSQVGLEALELLRRDLLALPFI